MSSASTWLLSRHQVLGPTRCLDDAQAALPWEGKGGRCNVLQPGAAWDLVPKSKDGTEHDCWHDCMELGTTARAGRGPEKPLKELWLLSMSIKSKGKEIGGLRKGETHCPSLVCSGVGGMAGLPTYRLVTLQLGGLSSLTLTLLCRQGRRAGVSTCMQQKK